MIGAFWSFVLLILFNSLGMMIAIFSVNDKDDDDFEPIEEPVETYDIDETKKSKKRRK